MSHLYDLMLLVDASAPEDRRQAVVAEAQSMIENGGTLVGHHDWGTRRISYEIDHRPEAEYHLFQFEGDNAQLDQLNHRLKITDGVLRFRIIRQLATSPPVPPPPAATRAPAADEDDTETRVAARAAADAAPVEADAVPEAAEAAEPAELAEAPEPVEAVAAEDE